MFVLRAYIFLSLHLKKLGFKEHILYSLRQKDLEFT